MKIFLIGFIVLASLGFNSCTNRALDRVNLVMLKQKIQNSDEHRILAAASQHILKQGVTYPSPLGEVALDSLLNALRNSKTETEYALACENLGVPNADKFASALFKLNKAMIVMVEKFPELGKLSTWETEEVLEFSSRVSTTNFPNLNVQDTTKRYTYRHLRCVQSYQQSVELYKEQFSNHILRSVKALSDHLEKMKKKPKLTDTINPFNNLKTLEKYRYRHYTGIKYSRNSLDACLSTER